MDNLGCVSVFIRHDAMLRFNQIHLAAETGERLRQFASDRPRSDDSQARRQIGQRKNGLIGEITDLLEPGRGRVGSPPVQIAAFENFRLRLPAGPATSTVPVSANLA